MILWGKAWFLLVLIVPVALFVLELILRSRDRKSARRFASLSLWPRISPGHSVALVRAKRLLFIVAMLILVVGIANPRVGTRYEDVVREGIDIVLAVDVSRSMDSQDIRPSRIGKARYELARFIEGMKGDRVGIVPFAGTAYPLLPLTLDYAAAKMFVDLLDAELIPNPGTALGDAIETSLKVFSDDQDRAKVVVLVSDGEDHEGDAVEAARKAANQGVQIFTIGMAREKGDPIPVFNDLGTRTGWLTDEDGQIVTSRLNEEILRDIASAGNGEYRRADEGSGAFNELYKELFQLERGEFETKQISGHEDRFPPILIAALLLLIVQFMLPDVRKPKNGHGLNGNPKPDDAEPKAQTSNRTMKATTTAVFLIAGMLTLLAAPASAEIPHKLVKKGNKEVVEENLDQALEDYLRAGVELDTLRPELLYNLGGVYSRMGESGRADTLFRSLSPESDEDLLARADYNRGTTLAEAQQYDQAIPALIDALKKNPNDEDAKINLELALRQQQQQQQQQNQNQDQNENQDQQNQDQQKQDGDEQQDKQDQQDQEQEEQEEEKQGQEEPQQDQQQNPEDQQQQQQPPPPDDLNKEMAERLLNQMQQDEKEQLKQVIRQQVPVRSKGNKKPW
ncbi:VWA domain-containing protein [bacterium]|nr:VWA domain-containing protein [bacterium]